MARYLDPKNDLTCKRIFGERPEPLIKLLNAVMPFDEMEDASKLSGLTVEQIQTIINMDEYGK